MGPCERCKRAQATYHLTNIEPGGAKTERHLCERCAAEEGWLPQQKGATDVNALLEQFVAGAKGQGGAVAGLVCENCGMSYVEFRNQGLLGCAQDYDVFKEPIAKLLQQAHDGATHHVGKAPRTDVPRQNTQQELRKLRRLLDEAVAGEDYERAARLRDRIRAAEEK
ncbi:MAG: UvrB/UvrC motif-containing protein [Phycisphaerae bacterium]